MQGLKKLDKNSSAFLTEIFNKKAEKLYVLKRNQSIAVFFKEKSMQKQILEQNIQSLKTRSVNNLGLPLIKRKYLRAAILS